MRVSSRRQGQRQGQGRRPLRVALHACCRPPPLPLPLPLLRACCRPPPLLLSDASCIERSHTCTNLAGIGVRVRVRVRDRVGVGVGGGGGECPSGVRGHQ